MVNREKMLFRWQDFESNVSTSFRDLREEADFFDVTIGCTDFDGRTLQAHKVILSASSLFFKNILRKHDHPKPFIYLKGVSFQNLSSILDFIYHGEVTIEQEDLESYLVVANELNIKGVVDKNGTVVANADEESSVDNFYNDDGPMFISPTSNPKPRVNLASIRPEKRKRQDSFESTFTVMPTSMEDSLEDMKEDEITATDTKNDDVEGEEDDEDEDNLDVDIMTAEESGEEKKIKELIDSFPQTEECNNSEECNNYMICEDDKWSCKICNIPFKSLEYCEKHVVGMHLQFQGISKSESQYKKISPRKTRSSTAKEPAKRLRIVSPSKLQEETTPTKDNTKSNRVSPKSILKSSPPGTSRNVNSKVSDEEEEISKTDDAKDATMHEVPESHEFRYLKVAKDLHASSDDEDSEKQILFLPPGDTHEETNAVFDKDDNDSGTDLKKDDNTEENLTFTSPNEDETEYLPATTFESSASQQKDQSSSKKTNIDTTLNMDCIEPLDDGSKRVRCKKCDKVLSTYLSSKQHVEIVHNDNPVYYECTLCQKVVKSKQMFRIHVGHKHEIRGKNIVSVYGKEVDAKDSVTAA